MSSQDECLSQRTAFHTAGSHKPIEVKQQSLARVAQLMGAIGQENGSGASDANNNSSEYANDFEGDEIDDDLVFSTVPQRSSIPTTTQIHFDEIDDDEMRRFAESFEQEQEDVKMDENDPIDDDNDGEVDDDDIDDDQLCQDYAQKMQTPTKSVQTENNKRKQRSLEDLDALLNDDDDEESNDNDDNHSANQMQQQQMSPVFKKKP